MDIEKHFQNAKNCSYKELLPKETIFSSFSDIYICENLGNLPDLPFLIKLP